MKKLLLVAHDLSPTKAFTALGAKLTEEGQYVVPIVGDGFPDAQYAMITEHSATTDLILVGMSSDAKRSEKEIFALQAARANGKPYGFFSDTRECWKGREWFAPYKPNASVLFVTSVEEVLQAGTGPMFARATITAVGHPSREANNVPALPREEARARLGIAANEHVLLCVGTKMQEVNLELLTMTAEALKALAGSNVSYKAVFCPHPSDKASETNWADARELFPNLIIPPPQSHRSIDLLLGADLVLNSLSSLFLEAAFARKAIAAVIGPIINGVRAKEFGAVEPPQAKEGSMAVAHSVNELVELLRRLQQSNGFAEQARVQAELYNPQPPGTAVRLMSEAITRALA